MLYRHVEVVGDVLAFLALFQYLCYTLGYLDFNTSLHEPGALIHGYKYGILAFHTRQLDLHGLFLFSCHNYGFLQIDRGGACLPCCS